MSARADLCGGRSAMIVPTATSFTIPVAALRWLPLRAMIRESALSQHAVERFLSGDRVFPGTRARIMKTVQKLERAKCAR